MGGGECKYKPRRGGVWRGVGGVFISQYGGRGVREGWGSGEGSTRFVPQNRNNKIRATEYKQ